MVSIRPVLLPYRSALPDVRGGVGTPYIVYDVRRDRYWLLFTGWSDLRGLRREGFAAPIDESLNVDLSQAKKILPADFPQPADYTNNAIRGLYNAAKDEFYVTSTHGKDAYMAVFDHDWNLKGYKILIHGLNKDSGLPIRPMGAYRNIKDAVAVAPRGESTIEMFLVRNIDDLNNIRVEDWGELGSWNRANDVIDFTLIPRFQVFVEITPTSKWILHTFIGPSLDELYLPEDLANVGMLSASLMPLLGFEDSFTQIGHPHYTTLPDGRPKLLVASFRDTWSARPDTGKEGYTHEIWAVYVDESIFDPRSYGELRGMFTGTESKWYYVPSADRLIVSISNEAELVGKIDLHDDNEQVIKLNKGINIIDKPTTWVKIRTNTQTKATIKAVIK